MQPVTPAKDGGVVGIAADSNGSARSRQLFNSSCSFWSRSRESNPNDILTKDAGCRYIRAAVGADDGNRTRTCSLEGFYAAVEHYIRMVEN